MSIQTRWITVVAAAVALVACGGGSVEETSITSDVVHPAEVRYSTGCVVSSPGFSKKADISVWGSLASTAATVAVDVERFSDETCTTRQMRTYSKGPAVLSGETKTLSNGAATKLGYKGQFTTVDVSLFGVSLSISPTGQTGNFVVVDEGDKLYFGRGSRDVDGYPSVYSLTPALKL